MNRWQEKLDQHPIHKTLEWLREGVSTEFNDFDENEIPEKRRILKIISAYEEILDQLDPELIPFNQLDSLNTALRHQNVTNQINSYISNGNVPHLVQLNDLIANQLTPLSLLKSLLENSSAKAPAVKDLEGLIDSISATLVEKKDSFSSDLTALSDTVKEQQELFQQLSNNIEKKKQEVDSHINEWQQQFSAAQEGRSQDFTAWREKFTEEKNEKIETTIAEYKQTFSDFTDKFKQEIDDILHDGQEKHDSILELYELTAGDSVGAGYLKNASDEKQQADRWRWISVGFIVCTVVWLLSSYYFNFAAHTTGNITSSTQVHSQTLQKEENKSQNISSPLPLSNLPWFRLLTTFSISGVLLWGSTYSAQQSTKHRNNEKRTRWFAMEMKAFDPFISSLDVEERKELKKELCQRVFGRTAECKEDNPTVMDEHVLKTFADTISEKVISRISKII